MSISASTAPSPKSCWSNAEDNLLRSAIWHHNIDNPTTPFPKDHFDMCFQFTTFIKKYLPNLSKTSKQVRERCVNHIISKARSFILPQDQEKALSLYHEYVKEGETRIWMRMSQFFYEKNHKEFYYSANALKNFVYGHLKSLERKENKPAKEAPPFQKKRRIEPASQSSTSADQSIRPVSAPPIATRQHSLTLDGALGGTGIPLLSSAEEISLIYANIQPVKPYEAPPVLFRQHSLTLDGALGGTGIPVLGDLEEAALRNTPPPMHDTTHYPEESKQCSIPSHSPVDNRWLSMLDDNQQAALENEVFSNSTE